MENVLDVVKRDIFKGIVALIFFKRVYCSLFLFLNCTPP